MLVLIGGYSWLNEWIQSGIPLFRACFKDNDTEMAKQLYHFAVLATGCFGGYKDKGDTK